MRHGGGNFCNGAKDRFLLNYFFICLGASLSRSNLPYLDRFRAAVIVVIFFLLLVFGAV